MSEVKMKQPSIFEHIYNKFVDKESVTMDEIKELLTKTELMDFKTYLRIFSKTIFRVYSKDFSSEKTRQIMVLRREFYCDDPSDKDEYKELIEYFEDVEDYESCQKINANKK